MTKNPDFILFAQHGWADTHHQIAKLANALTTPQTCVITPNLGWLKTWLRIQPLIAYIEQIATETISHYPQTPIKIIGHSLGGLIWLEVLSKHPEWWSKIHSLVLIASPVGGADLARIFDPWGIGIGIASDLAINRRHIAQLIAKIIPTLVIAGDIDGGSDGTITIGTTNFTGANFVCLPRISHAQLKNHPQVIPIIREFWLNPVISPPPIPDFTVMLIERLQSIPGMMDAHRRDFYRAKPYLMFNNGLTLRTWRHPLQVEHVFVANSAEECLYSGFVGLMNIKTLHQALEEIRKWADEGIDNR